MQMLGSNIGNISLQQTSNSSKENIKETFQSTLIKLTTLSLIIFLFLLILADKLFKYILEFCRLSFTNHKFKI